MDIMQTHVIKNKTLDLKYANFKKGQVKTKPMLCIILSMRVKICG